MVCVFAELAVPSLTAQSPPGQPAPNQRSVEEVITELEAMKQRVEQLEAMLKAILVAGQKTGIIWAQDPDRKCAFVWKTFVASKQPGPQGRVDFAGSADGRNAYFGPRRGAS